MVPTQSIAVTATGQVLPTGPGVLAGAHLAAAAANAVATIHDGVDATGPILARLAAAANTADDLGIPIAFRTGLHVVLSGAGAHLNVFV